MYGQSPRGRSRAHSSRSRPRPDLWHPPAPLSRLHRWASLDGRPALFYEGVCCAAQKMAVPLKQRNGVPNSAGGSRGWSRSIEHTHTHAAGCSESKKKKVKIMPHPDGPSRQGPPSFCWVWLLVVCRWYRFVPRLPGVVPGAPGRLIEKERSLFEGGGHNLATFFFFFFFLQRPRFAIMPCNEGKCGGIIFWCGGGRGEYRCGLGRSASVREEEEEPRQTGRGSAPNKRSLTHNVGEWNKMR